MAFIKYLAGLGNYCFFLPAVSRACRKSPNLFFCNEIIQRFVYIGARKKRRKGKNPCTWKGSNLQTKVFTA
jgi:hypothetical protein